MNQPHPLSPRLHCVERGNYITVREGQGTARRAPTHRFSFAVSRLRVFALTLFVCFCAACNLNFGTSPTLAPDSTPASASHLVVVWANADGDLSAWRDDDPTPRLIASGSAITPYLAPDGQHVAFTRGSQGEPVSLWSVGIDGTGASELVAPGDVPAQGRGRPEIAQVAWLDATTIYFNSRQLSDTRSVADENLYRVEFDGSPQLILPPGAGGDFSISPDGQWIAVASAGVYDTQKGRVSILDPLGASVSEALTFTALAPPQDPPVTPPLDWTDDSAFVRVPIPNLTGLGVTLWRIPVAPDPPDDKASIFGTVGALSDGLPHWGKTSMIYLQTSDRRIALVIANASGEAPTVYTNGRITDPRWLPDGIHFAYQVDVTLWIGARGETPRLLIDVPVERAIFAGAWVVYTTTAGELRAQRIDGSDNVLITASANPAFDALITTDEATP